MGLIPRRLPFTTSNQIVRTFRHALALDERRAKFKANLWNRPNETEATLGIQGHKADVSTHHVVYEPNESEHGHEKACLHKMERKYSDRVELPTDVEEVCPHFIHWQSLV